MSGDCSDAWHGDPMVAHIPVSYVLADTLCCLGLGFLLAALYDAVRCLLGNAKPVCFVLDMAAFFLAAVLLCSFSASRSYSGVVRWYMVAGLGCGMIGYFFVLAPSTERLHTLLMWGITLPFRLLWILLIKPIGRLIKVKRFAAVQKHRTKAAKRRTKQLQKKAQVLYNSN